MRKSLIFLSIFMIFQAVFGVSSALADAKPWPLSWWPGHFDNMDFERRYVEDGKIPHHAAYYTDRWQPQDWSQARGSGSAMIQDFYKAEIITDQYDDDDIPVLEVGPGFMRLSGLEKRRVAEFVDHVYGITASGPGVYYLYHHRTCNPIGVYTKQGLQLQ